MESITAVTALEALAQESRLAIFRALVKAGPPGVTPSRLSEDLAVAAPTLSFHLAQLRHAGLITVTRHGRSLTYAAAFDVMQDLLGYLTENCCANARSAPSSCAPLKRGTSKRTAGVRKTFPEAAIRSRRERNAGLT